MSAQPPARPHRRALAFIFVTALIDVMSLGIMIPVLPNLVKQLAGGDTATGSLWVGLFGTLWALMQFVFSPVLGMLSDRYGRRPVILLSVLGLGLEYVFMALAPSLSWLLVGRLIHGATAASFSTASAYIADVTPPEGRAKAFGLIGAAWGAGFVLGPALGGLLGGVDLRAPFWVSAGLALCNFLYGLFILPESLPPERRTPRMAWARANPLGSFRLLSSHKDLFGLAGVVALFQLASQVLPSIFVLYTGYRYHWSTAQVGVMLAATGVASIVTQAVIVGWSVRRLGERGTLLVGLLFGALGFVVYGLAPTGTAFWWGIPVFALSGLIQPGVLGLMSRRVGPSEQGQLQGANSSIMGLMGLVGPALYTGTFAWSIRGGVTGLHQPGLPVLIAAGLMAAGLLLAWAVGRAPRPARGPTAPA